MVLSSFVGRARLLAELRERDARLVTLTGPGGVGKTRLAAEFARDRDDVVLVELAEIGQADELLPSIGEVLKIKDHAARNSVDALCEYLADRDVLLVLDNCEHLREEIAELAEALLAGTPKLRVLATSREALGIAGEQVLRVPPLEMPPSADGPLDTGYEAVALLADRAAASVPGWQLDQDDWPHVVRLLHRVGGLPLGIELATVRLRAMPITEVVRRLDDQVRLLTRNDRVALPHHRTLRAVIDWSHDLCTPAEQRLWARASAFAGGFDLAAAEGVCGPDVADDLAGLVAKSIVSFEQDRYHLLEPLRQYGAERLEASGERDAVLGRHLDHFAALVRKVADGWAFDLGLIATLRTEMANVRVALATSMHEPDRAVELTLHLGRTHDAFFANSLPEQYRGVRRALAAPGISTARRVEALAFASWLALALGLAQDAAELLEEAEELNTEVGSPGVRFVRGQYMWLVEARVDSLAVMREARDVFFVEPSARLGDRILFAAQVAMAAAMLADEPGARKDIADTIELMGGQDIPIAIAAVGMPEAVLEVRFGDPERAVELLLAALRQQRELGDRWGPIIAVEVLAWAHAAAGSAHRAARLLGAAQALQRLAGQPLSRNETFKQMHAEAVARTRGHEREFAKGAALRSFEEIFALALDDEQGPLTPAQLEVAGFVAAGLTNREIAKRLHKSPRTVETQLQQIFAALGVNRRALVAQWFNAQSS